MKKLIQLNVNGDRHEIAISPETSLLNALRGELDLIGPKKGSAEKSTGDCSC